MSILPSSIYQKYLPTIEILQMKHRLFYVNLRMISLLKECTDRVLQTTDDNTDINTAAINYKKIEQILYNKNLERTELSTVNNLLETELISLHEKKVELLKLLANLLEELHTKKLVNALGDLDFQYEDLLQILNDKREVSKEVLVNWENKLEQFTDRFKRRVVKEDLRLKWGSDYRKIISKAQILILYVAWETTLEKERKTISKAHPNADNIFSALKVLQLLNSSKEEFFLHFFQNPAYKTARLKMYMNLMFPLVSENLDSKRFLEKILHQIQEVKKRIEHKEKILRLSINKIHRSVAYVLNIFLHNHYTSTADFLISSQEKMTQSERMKKLPFLSMPLQSSYLSLSKGMVASSLFFLDVVQWRWLGISHSMLSAISQRFMPGVNAWTPIFQFLKMDEKTVLSCMPALHKISAFVTFIGIHLYSSGLRTHSIEQLTLSFVTASAMAWTAIKAVDLLYKSFHPNPKNSSTYPFLRGIVQWIAFPLSMRYLVPFLFEKYRAFFIYPDNIFEDPSFCQNHKKFCQKEACKLLGVSETASLSEIKKAFYFHAKKLHPDHNPMAKEQYLKIVQAKNLCSQAC